MASIIGLAAAAAHGATPGDAAWRKEIEDWRAQRLQSLRAPYGWPSLVGLEWLKPGVNKIGSAKDNDVVIAKAPAHLGTLTLADGKAHLALAPKSVATIDGIAQDGADLVDDRHGQQTLVAFGSVQFYFIKRGDKAALRIKDSDAPARKAVIAHGIESFPLDPSWRIEAKWEPYNPPHEVEVTNIIGQVDKFATPGAAVFVREGKTYRLEPMLETPDDKELFLVFADRTSGKETYGAARFLYAEMPKDGKIVLDFNKAYNPPCAFTPYATCPLPTPQNRLDLRVTAGEKKFAAGHD